VNVAPHSSHFHPRPLPLQAPSPSAVPFQSLFSSNSTLRPLCLGGKPVSISFTFFRLRALKLSCSFFSYSRPLFSIVYGLSDENTRDGIPLPDLRESQVTSHKSRPSCAKTQKCPPVSPLRATLTDSLSRNPFVCHSYANTRGVGATPRKFFSPLATRHSPLLPLSSFRINT